MTRTHALPTMPWDVRLMDRLASAMFVVAVLAFVVIGVRWFIRLPMFVVQTIVVDGDMNHNTSASLSRHAVPRMEGNVFTLDLAQAQRAFETTPWVRRAMVRRIWPNRLHVSLEEHRPAAFWHQDGADAQVVNTFGEVFEINMADLDDASLPFLQGPEGTSAEVLSMHAKLSAVFNKLAVRVETLEYSTRGAWRVELDNGAKVELGRGEEADVVARSVAFVDTLPQLTTRYQAPLIYADLRHRDGYAVRLRGVGTSDAPSLAAVKQRPGALNRPPSSPIVAASAAMARP